jgi:hypothetical protein
VDILKEHPKLKGFAAHGVLFGGVIGTEANGTCPFCGRAQKFYCHTETLFWRCMVCGKTGNFERFLAAQSSTYRAGFLDSIATKLCGDRSLAHGTLEAFGVGWQGEFYTIPEYVGDQVVTIMRYYPDRPKEKRSLSTPGTHAGLYRPLMITNSQRVFLMEGQWDGMAAWESLRSMNISDDVYATQGSAFPATCAPAFYGKDVIVVMDNDLAGDQNAERIYGTLLGRCKSMRFVHWGNRAEGYDFRNLFIDHEKCGADAIGELEALLQPKPPSAKRGAGAVVVATGPVKLTSGPTPTRDEVIAGYRKWLYLPNTDIIDVAYGTIFANNMGASPLWTLIIAASGGAKSAVLLSFEDSPLVCCETSVSSKGMISGMNVGKGGDPSLIPLLMGKTWIIKDMAPILGSDSDKKERETILSFLRDAWDGRCGRHFGGPVSRKYVGVKFGILAGVTYEIEKYRAEIALLGERFINYKVYISPSTIREICRRKARNHGHEDEMDSDLRDLAKRALERKVLIPKLTDDQIEEIISLAEWVESMRVVVSREKYTREMQYRPVKAIASRLCGQLHSFALGLMSWRGETEMSETTHNILMDAAQGTCPDIPTEVVRLIFINRNNGWAKQSEIVEWIKVDNPTINTVLTNLVTCKVLQNGDKGVFRIAPVILKLMSDVNMYSREKAWSRVHRITAQEEIDDASE